MTSDPMEVGTLIVVILKAKNLPNKRHIGKQDPYCSVKLNNETRRTKAIRRGGQHPEWDEEVRFTIFEDAEDELARTAAGDGDEPPPLPPKKDKKKVKSGKTMQLICYADDPREPDLIGETTVDLTEVLTKGETDEWFTLTSKDKYCGEVYLELTFWSNEKPPEKQAASTSSAFHPQYGGPGSFTPSAEIPAALKHGGSNHSTPNSSRLPSDGGADHALPTSLRPSGSLAKLNLYSAPYEQQNLYGNPVDQLSNGIASLDVDGNTRRRESFPAGPSEFGYAGRPPLHSGSFSTLSSAGSISSIHSHGTSSSGARVQGHHRESLSSLPEPFAQDDYSPGHSNAIPHPSAPYTPDQLHQYPHAISGFRAPSTIHPTIQPQYSTIQSGPYPTPSSFVAPNSFPSQTLPVQYPVPPQSSFQTPYPHPPTPAPANQYPPFDTSLHHASTPPVSHSAPPQQYTSHVQPSPPQQYTPHVQPSPPHPNIAGLPPSTPYQQVQQNNPLPGSRPLPNPQPPRNQPSSGFMPPGPSQSASPGPVMFPTPVPLQHPTPPHPQPSRRGSLPPTPTKVQPVSFPPPPPPPLPLIQNGMHLTQQTPNLNTPPRPPLPPSQSSSPPSHLPHSSLPQPESFGSFPPPPPPPTLSSYSQPSHILPTPTGVYSTPPQGQQLYYPGPTPPPPPPPQFPTAPSWQPQEGGWH